MVTPSRLALAVLLALSCAPSRGGRVERDAAQASLAAEGGSHDSGSMRGSDASRDGGNVLARDAAAPSFAAWLRRHLPEGGAVLETAAAAPRVVHTVRQGDTAETIAVAYVGLTDVYYAKDLATEIASGAVQLAPGARVEIPHLIAAPLPDDPEEGRLGWPRDRALRGVFVTGAYAAIRWVDTLDKLAARGLNAVVLDGKDYEGPVNYPSKMPVAVEVGAYVRHHVPDLARAIRFAHARGIRVIMRIACFHDPWTAKHAPRLSLMGNWGGPFPMGWTDPTNVEMQDYILGLVEEQLAAGADEIQLDYVRFPVQSKSINAVVMPKPDGSRASAMKDFVHRVHDVTQAKGVPLSLDLFGVTATGDQSDIDKLGQDIGKIGSEAEVLSPMVYPSEYSHGYRGWAEPGTHPEIVGIGTKAAVAKLKAAKNDSTIIRSWLQASGYRATNYGPDYILKEAKSAEANGGVGWLLWSPGNDYWAAWKAFPVLNAADAGGR